MAAAQAASVNPTAITERRASMVQRAIRFSRRIAMQTWRWEGVWRMQVGANWRGRRGSAVAAEAWSGGFGAAEDNQKREVDGGGSQARDRGDRGGRRRPARPARGRG